MANLKLTFCADDRVEPNVEDWCAYSNFTAYEKFNATDKARCRKLLMQKIDGCQNQNTGQLGIESLLGQHQYHRLGILTDLASLPVPPAAPHGHCAAYPLCSSSKGQDHRIGCRGLGFRLSSLSPIHTAGYGGGRGNLALVFLIISPGHERSNSQFLARPLSYVRVCITHTSSSKLYMAIGIFIDFLKPG